jgi:hypothetical protein
MKKIYICGLNASGKGIIRSLLDGHQDIVNYDFDIGISLLRNEFTKYCSMPRGLYEQKIFNSTAINRVSISINIEEIPREITIGELFVYLFTSSGKYRDIFDVSLSGEKLVSEADDHFASQGYQFDVFGFLKSFAGRVVTVKNFDSIEQLQDILYQCVINNCEELKSNYSENSLFLQSSLSGYDIVEMILQRNKDRKIVAVVRDPVALCFANERRNAAKYGSGKNSKGRVLKYLYKYNSALFCKAFINKARYYNECILKLSQTEKDLYVIKTEDIICNTKDAMDGVADFLGIEKQDILYKLTFDGKPAPPDVAHSVGKVYDDPYKVLTSEQICMLKYLFYGWNQNESFINNVWTVYNLSILSAVNNKRLRNSLKAITGMSCRLRR